MLIDLNPERSVRDVYHMTSLEDKGARAQNSLKARVEIATVSLLSEVLLLSVFGTVFCTNFVYSKCIQLLLQITNISETFTLLS